MANIKSLLKKKGWTGEEVGKALLASLMNDIRYRGQEHEALFTQSDFNKMENSLSTDRDYLAYGVYRDIYSSVVDTYNRGQANYQQFYNGYYRSTMYLTGAIKADKALSEVENYPLIMSEEQYQRAVEETTERKKNYGESFYGLLFSLLENFLDALDHGEADSVPAQIAQAIADTKTVPASSKSILSSYNKIMRKGYFLLPDGRRSDKMTSEAWQEALKELFLSRYSYTVNGEQATPEETIREYHQQGIIKGHELYFKGVDAVKAEYRESFNADLPAEDDKEILPALRRVSSGNISHTNPLENSLDKLLFKYDTATNATWHYYDTPPEGLTQYDLLDVIVDASRYESSDGKAILREFKKDYPSLYSALETYIRETVPGAGSLKANQYYKLFVHWGELAELGIGNYAKTIAPANSDIIQLLHEKGEYKFSDKQRAFLRGIAVIKSPRSYQLDESGNYKENSLSELVTLDSIDNLTSSERVSAEIERLRNTLFIPALSYLYAYNALVEIIGDVYDIPDLTTAQFDTSRIEAQLTGYNALIYSFYYDVYGDKDERERKRKLIKETFTPVYADQYKPTARAIAQMRYTIASWGISTTARKALKDFDTLIAQLDNREGAC